MVKSVRFDLVLTDVNMPGMSGIDLLERVLETDRTVGVLLMSGSIHVTEESALESGAKGLIRKPFDEQVLMSQIELAVGSDKKDVA